MPAMTASLMLYISHQRCEPVPLTQRIGVLPAKPDVLARRSKIDDRSEAAAAFLLFFPLLSLLPPPLTSFLPSLSSPPIPFSSSFLFKLD